MLPIAPRPKFRDLPFYRDTKERCSWGVFGPDDELGTQNLLTEGGALDAIDHVKTGQWFSLNWAMELPNPTLFTREPMDFIHIDLAHLHAGSDDVYNNYYSQSSTQWDALNHVGTLAHEMYNGFSESDVHQSPFRLGIQNVGRRGIVGRFSLIDVAALWESEGRSVDLRDRTDIVPDDLERALKAQGTQVKEGDVLLVHTGWTHWYAEAPDHVRQNIGDTSQKFQCTFPGLAPSQETVEWLWDRGASAIVTDTPAVESGPFTLGSYDTFLHYRLIGLMGLTLGEMFYLHDLAAACAEDRRFNGLLVAAPFNKQGGAGSPGNAIAIR